MKHAGDDIFKFVSDGEIEKFATRPCNNIGRSKVCSAYHVGRVVIVGDSANPFPPIGQGVNHAMEAAIVLDQCIGDALEANQPLEVAAAAF